MRNLYNKNSDYWFFSLLTCLFYVCDINEHDTYSFEIVFSNKSDLVIRICRANLKFSKITNNSAKFNQIRTFILQSILFFKYQFQYNVKYILTY